MPESGHPWSIPLVNSSGADSYPSNFSIVFLPSTLRLIQSVYCGGTPLHFMLCMRWSSTTLRKAALTSRNRVLTTLHLLQVSFTYFVTKCSESEVVLPGRQPKWLFG